MDVKAAWVCFKRSGDSFQIASARDAAGADGMGGTRSLMNNTVSRQLARFLAASLDGWGNAREESRKTRRRRKGGRRSRRRRCRVKTLMVSRGRPGRGGREDK